MQVGPVEAADQHERVAHRQIGDDGLLDAARGGGGDGGDGRAPQRLGDGCEGDR